MPGKDVQKLYSIGHAKWYDLFKPIWNWFASRKAEAEFTRFLKKNLDNKTTILELACGTAANLEKIHSLKLPFKTYLGIDFTPDMLAIAKKKSKGMKNVEFRRADITTLKNPGKFDVIICTWALSHLESPAEFVNRTQKFLKKDGTFFLIFLSRPDWFIGFWLNPLSKYIFRAPPVHKNEIAKIKHTKRVRRTALGLTTIVEI